MWRFSAVIAVFTMLTGCADLVSPDPASQAASDRRSQIQVPPGTIIDARTSQGLSAPELARRLSSADVVILGEIHDNPDHHLAQAWLVGQLAPVGVAFEMIPQASEEGIAVLRANGTPAAEIGPAIGWQRMGWPDWAIYRPIFEQLGDAAIIGAGIPRTDVRRAIADGAAQVAAQPALVGVLSQALPPTQQRASEAQMIDAHCGHLPASAAPGMVEAQRLRDAYFADAALRARREQGQSVLIAGNGHARKDRGVPLYLTGLAPDAKVLSVGIIAQPTERTGQPFDFVWITPAVPDQEDPCAAFKQ